MNLLFRYLARRTLEAVAMSLLSLVLLFSFFDYISELADIRDAGYTAAYALLYVALNIPGRIQELLPIAALLGALFTFARLAANSEFTVMRASGLSAQRLLGYLGVIGLALGVIAFVIGEYVTPASERLAQQIKIRSSSRVIAQEFRSGLWAKDGGKFINIRNLLPDGRLGDIRIFEFDDKFELRSVIQARVGTWLRPGAWQLEDVHDTRLEKTGVSVRQTASLTWESAVSPSLLSALVVNPERMSYGALNAYIGYLRKNQQQTARYELALWNKLAFPLAAPVMLFLALPFGYQSPRSHAIGGRILLGILIGMGFHMLTRLLGNVGLINDWPAVISAFVPLGIAGLAAMIGLWQVERR
jgi:lipopolysaccharide export system permease protein